MSSLVKQDFVFSHAHCVLYSSAGQVPSLHEGNVKENIFNFPWLKDRSISLGMLIKLGLFLLQAYNHTYMNHLSLILYEICSHCLAGPRFKDAFQDPRAYLAIEPLFEVMPLSDRKHI